MTSNRPLILISNDDGFQAKGISALIRFLRPIGDIVVVAPDVARSGYATALTIKSPLHFSKVRQEVGLTVYKCTGTPTDCVKLAVSTILSRTPDLVIGGINHGDNSGVNIHYSGTMGIALEGAINNIPSIGFSLCNYSQDADFTPCGPYVKKIVNQVLQNGLPKMTCLNVNFPDTPEYKGIKICSQSKTQWVKEYEPFTHPFGETFYWMAGYMENLDPKNTENDAWALANGYVALVTAKVDLTDYALNEKMEQWDWSLPTKKEEQSLL